MRALFVGDEIDSVLADRLGMVGGGGRVEVGEGVRVGMAVVQGRG